MKVEKAYTIPKDWGMEDLSPKNYAKLVDELQADEQATLAFSNKIGMNKPSVVITGIACDLRCRLFFTCDKNYADNEQIMYCRGGLVDL